MATVGVKGLMLQPLTTRQAVVELSSVSARRPVDAVTDALECTSLAAGLRLVSRHPASSPTPPSAHPLSH